MRFGLLGVRRFFVVGYAAGLAVVTATLHAHDPQVDLLFGVAGGGERVQLWRLTGDPREYRAVMRLRHGASLALVGFIAAALGWRLS